MTVPRRGPARPGRQLRTVASGNSAIVSRWRYGGMILEGLIGVAGAGSIGCFVGGMCAAAGRHVALLARPRVIQEIESNGLTLTSFEGAERKVEPRHLTLSDDPRVFAEASMVLVTVKSADTAEIADAIARHAPPD